MLTTAPCALSMRHCTTFRTSNALFSEVSLVHCNLWNIIHQQLYQPQLYNVNELKCAYGVAQWH